MARPAPVPDLPLADFLWALRTEYQAALARRFGVSQRTILRWRRRWCVRYEPPEGVSTPLDLRRPVDPVQAVEWLPRLPTPPEAPLLRAPCVCSPQTGTCLACQAWEAGHVLELDGTWTLRLQWVRRWTTHLRRLEAREAEQREGNEDGWMPI